MLIATARRLLELNRQFYADFGSQFSATRQRLQPGVRRLLPLLHGSERLLDLGCGNGELARALARDGFRGAYTGLDFSPPLLAVAASQPGGMTAAFFEADLTSPDWDLRLQPGRFPLVTAFALLHHIPQAGLRLGMIRKIHGLLQPGGKFILSSWQFLNNEKLAKRIQPWQAAGLSPADVDEGDYLLDWRSGGQGLRYVHHFSGQELEQLAAAASFTLSQSFLSDGEGGRLGLYQVWERDENKR